MEGPTSYDPRGTNRNLVTGQGQQGGANGRGPRQQKQAHGAGRRDERQRMAGGRLGEIPDIR